MKELLASGLSLQLKGKIWIETEQNRFLGPGPVELLLNIQEHGSISKAAAAMEMSYKKAWDLVTNMNQQTQNPFVISQAGGKQGGGAIVTEAGIQAINQYQKLQERFLTFLAHEQQKL